MLIAGVIIICKPEQAIPVLASLKDKDGITTYGIHKNDHIVAVFEALSSNQLEVMTEETMRSIPDILGIYPAYVNFEDVQEENVKND